jgi:hypothetical protein
LVLVLVGESLSKLQNSNEEREKRKLGHQIGRIGKRPSPEVQGFLDLGFRAGSTGNEGKGCPSQGGGSENDTIPLNHDVPG